jgi:hypothetical protein
MWSTLFSVLSAIPLYCMERRLVQGEVVNGAYKFSTHCVAQFLVTLPFNFVAAFVYELCLHWMVGFNDWFPAFVYSVLMAWALLQTFDGVLLCITETLKHPMLVASVAMMALGLFSLFAGFFIAQDELAPAVRWICYLVTSCKFERLCFRSRPTLASWFGASPNPRLFKNNPLPVYALRGSIVNTLNGQRFHVAENQTIDGGALIESAFHYTTTDKWADFAIVVAWAVAFRLLHYGMLIFNNRHYGESLGRVRGMATAPRHATFQSAAADSAPETTTTSVVSVVDFMPLSSAERQSARARSALYSHYPSQRREMQTSVV